jgi:predicted 3-demethylubiquinone-9 3-methyltransferase (glyoxalase superfamily)
MTQKITPFLWFNDNAEEAINFYLTVFKNSRIKSVQRFGEAAPGSDPKLLTATFELNGQEFMALNGGPQFQFTEAISLMVKCETQEEVDDYWNKLIEGGGKPQQCGWLKDKFGLSWQIIPNALGELLGAREPDRARRVMEAMLKMTRIEVAKLQEAYNG